MSSPRARGGFTSPTRSPAPHAKPGQNPQGADQTTSTQPYSDVSSGTAVAALQDTAHAMQPTEDAVKTNRWGS